MIKNAIDNSCRALEEAGMFDEGGEAAMFKYRLYERAKEKYESLNEPYKSMFSSEGTYMAIVQWLADIDENGI